LNGYSFESDNKHLKIIDSILDLYKLFNQFNLEFFYEKLLSVCVKKNGEKRVPKKWLPFF